MFDSVLEDLKFQFRSGNMVTRLIIINAAVFVVTALTQAFAPSFYASYVFPNLAIPGKFMDFLFKPWTLMTHMFVHSGLRHVFWNMLMLYWFGRIVGDRIGDKHIWPIYLMGALAGALAYLVSYTFVMTSVNSAAVGASAAIMALAIIAGRINPDYEMRLLILGNIKIKWIVLALIFIDLMMIGKGDNTGGHIAHLGGLVMGWLYFDQIGGANDLENKVNRFGASVMGMFYADRKPAKKSPLSVKFKSEKIKNMSERRADASESMQSEVDAILDKIKQKGYDNLTDAEKDVLFKASKK